MLLSTHIIIHRSERSSCEMMNMIFLISLRIRFERADLVCAASSLYRYFLYEFATGIVDLLGFEPKASALQRRRSSN